MTRHPSDSELIEHSFNLCSDRHPRHIGEHLAQCSECKARADRLAGRLSALEALRDDSAASETLIADTLRRVRTLPERRTFPLPRLVWVVGAAAAAALVLMAVIPALRPAGRMNLASAIEEKEKVTSDRDRAGEEAPLAAAAAPAADSVVLEPTRAVTTVEKKTDVTPAKPAKAGAETAMRPAAVPATAAETDGLLSRRAAAPPAPAAAAPAAKRAYQEVPPGNLAQNEPAPAAKPALAEKPQQMLLAADGRAAGAEAAAGGRAAVGEATLPSVAPTHAAPQIPTDTVNLAVMPHFHEIVTPHGVRVVMDPHLLLSNEERVLTATHQGLSPVRLLLIAWEGQRWTGTSGITPGQRQMPKAEERASECTIELQPGEIRKLRFSKTGWEVMTEPAPAR
jgi:hypothetical protein